MPAIHKGSPKIKFEFVAAQRQSVLGGLPAIEALAQEFDLWHKLRRLSLIDPRKRKGSGFGPDAIVAQFVYCFAAGGASLADAERLEEDSLARRLARMDCFADETTLGEWLRAQTPESVRAFWELIQAFIAWAAQRAEAGRWKYSGRAEVFFDDTQLEVSGKKFEGAKVNYNGDLALSWQTFWFGPWLADGQLGSPGDVSEALPAMLESNQSLWAQGESDFLADSGSSAAKYLQAIRAAGFTHWSVSYNKWTSALERTAVAQPETAWSAPVESVWRDGSPITEQHGLIRHTPEASEATFEFAAVRFRKAGEMFWNYRFLACGGDLCAAQIERREGATAQGSVARTGFASSALRGTAGQCHVLRDCSAGLQPFGHGETAVPAGGMPELAGQDDAATNHSAAGNAGAACAAAFGASGSAGHLVGVVGELAEAVVVGRADSDQHELSHRIDPTPSAPGSLRSGAVCTRAMRTGLN